MKTSDRLDREEAIGRAGLNLWAATAWVVSAYLVGTGLLVLQSKESLPGWPLLLAAHLGVVALIWLTARMAMKSRFSRFLRDWYPILLMPFLFKEVELLARHLGDWRLTTVLQRWEVALFEANWSVELSSTLPSVALSEFLHFSYFAYLLLVPLVAGRWYFSRRKQAFSELLFLVATTAYASYSFFILFPVDSPFYLQPPPGGPLAGYPFYELVHVVSGHGGARGGAFPSAHVSITTVVWLVVWKNERRLALWLLPLAFGIFVATVYGRFHYVLDVFAGWGLALLVYAAFSLCHRRPVKAAR